MIMVIVHDFNVLPAQIVVIRLILETGYLLSTEIRMNNDCNVIHAYDKKVHGMPADMCSRLVLEPHFSLGALGNPTSLYRLYRLKVRRLISNESFASILSI